MDKISIIIPCFNEEDALPIYYDEMKKVMDIMKKQSDFELIFVDDGSSDRTYEIMKELHRKDGRCQYLSFSRNFGKEAAIYADFRRQVAIRLRSWWMSSRSAVTSAGNVPDIEGRSV